MLKKVISIVILLCLIFSISVMAENDNPASEESLLEVSQQIHQNEEELPQGGRGNMGMPPSGDMQGRTPPQGEFIPPQNNDTNNNTQTAAPQTDGDTPAENSQMPGGNQQFDGRMPGGMGGFPGNMQNFNEQTQEEQPVGFLGFVKTNFTPITSVIFLALAFIFVIFYRRKNY